MEVMAAVLSQLTKGINQAQGNKDLCFKTWKEKKTLKQVLVEVKDSHSEYNATHESNKLKN